MHWMAEPASQVAKGSQQERSRCWHAATSPPPLAHADRITVRHGSTCAWQRRLHFFLHLWVPWCLFLASAGDPTRAAMPAALSADSERRREMSFVMRRVRASKADLVTCPPG